MNGFLGRRTGLTDNIGQLGDMSAEGARSSSAISQDRGRQVGGFLITDRAREPLDRRVSGDLKRLGGAGVLSVLENLLLATRTGQEIEWRL